MDWRAVEAPQEQVALAQALMGITAQRGWNREALAEASLAAFADPLRWQMVFPDGEREAIWFISRISDASMKAAFDDRGAPGMSKVILTRLAQNSDLKTFVRQVMLFDVVHPLQALARMQRTARVMMACVAGGKTDWISLTCLNLVYTVIVFIWLFDGTKDGRRTAGATRWAMRRLGFY